MALVLVAVALRAYRLGSQSLWSDEDITLDRTAVPVGQLVAGLPVEQAPLYFVAMRLWGLAAGSTDWALRWPSLAFGVLAVPLAAELGRRLAGRRAGAILAMLMAVNPFLVWYGQEARMYTLVGLLCLASLVSVMRGRAGGGARWWLAAGVAAALAVYTHYWAALLWVILGAWAGVDLITGSQETKAAQRGLAGGWSLAAVAAALCFLPWVPRAVQVGGFPGWRQPLPLARIPWIVLSAWSAGSTSSPAAVRWVTWLYLVSAAIGLAAVGARVARTKSRHRASRSLRLLAYALAPAAVMALALGLKPDFHPRYFMAVVPAYLLLVAVGADALPSAAPGAAASVLALAALPSLHGLYADPAFQKQDYRAVIRQVEEATWSGPAGGSARSVLLLDGPPFGTLDRYKSKESPVTILNLQSTTRRELSQPALDAEIERRVAGVHDIWLAVDGSAAGTAMAWLAGRAFLVDHVGVQQVTLSHYWIGSARCRATPARPVSQPDSIGLDVGLADSSDPGIVPICLVWHVGARPGSVTGKAYRVSLRLVDPDGRAVAHDADPVLGTRPTTSWRPRETIVDRRALAVPGGYQWAGRRVEVLLYDPDTLRPIGDWRWIPNA